MNNQITTTQKIMYFSFISIFLINILGLIELMFNFATGAQHYFIFKTHYSLFLSLFLFYFIINNIPKKIKEYRKIKKQQPIKKQNELIKEEKVFITMAGILLIIEWIAVIPAIITNDTSGEPVILSPIILTYFTTLLFDFYEKNKTSKAYFPWF
jgi:cell division protein FtsL